MADQLNTAIASCRNLPSPAGIAMRIIALAQDPDTDVGIATETIALDPALTARIMRLSNSPLYASRRRVTTLNQAIMMLGLHTTLQMSLGFSLIAQFQYSDLPHKAHRYLCKRSIIAATAARLLGEIRQLHQAEELMLAGLLQDIGAIALLQLQTHTYAELLQQRLDRAQQLSREIELFGCTHADIGSQLCTQWRLPSSLSEAITCSEQPDATDDQFKQCIALSGYIADIWFADDPSQAKSLAKDACSRILQLSEQEFEQIFLSTQQHIPEISTLFETHIDTPDLVKDLLDQAAEISLLRQLREQQDATMLREQSMELQQRAQDLVDQVHRDPLTGVTNRRHMDVVLEQEFQLATVTDKPLSLAFIDLDDFKKINDRHGHVTGDQVLKCFAQKVEEQLRGTDTVARMGGEEFIVLFPATREATAASIIKRVLENISNTPIPTPDGSHLAVTFSAGIATHGENENYNTAEDLLRSADEVLYNSKHLGRNRVQTRSAMQRLTTDCTSLKSE